jgi:transposase
MEQRIIYVGLDVHKDTNAVALAEAGKRGELREYGKIANTPTALRTLAAKLASHGWRLRFCYEAGPCGYGIQRQLARAQTGSANGPKSTRSGRTTPLCVARHF